MTACTLLALTLACLQPDTLGVHLVSRHAERNKGPHAWNNENPGLYARWGPVVAGVYRNSLHLDSAYLALHAQRGPWGLTGGLVTGYDRLTHDNVPAATPGASYRCDGDMRCRWVTTRAVVLPFVAPSILAGPVRLTLFPKMGADSAAALHLSLEWRL